MYNYSRNPGYLISILQGVIWSLVLQRGALAAQPEPIAIAAAIFVLIPHYFGIYRWIIPKEEEALRRAHPEAFARNSRKLNHWFGRRQ